MRDTLGAVGRKPFAPAAAHPRLGKFRLRTGRRTPITTTGRLRAAPEAFVYVGVSRTGRVKVGMTGNPDARAKDLRVRIVHLQPVVPTAAKLVETEALRRLGNAQADGEWGEFTPDAAIRAVKAAYEAIGRQRHVDPAITDEEARRRRVADIAPHVGGL